MRVRVFFIIYSKPQAGWGDAYVFTYEEARQRAIEWSKKTDFHGCDIGILCETKSFEHPRPVLATDET